MPRTPLSLVVIFFIWTVYSQPAHAAPAYSTHMPDEGRWRWGGQASFIADRNLDNDKGAVDGDRYFITGSYGIFRWLSFDGKIGLGDVKWHTRRADNDLSYGRGFAGGYGFRIKVYENEDWGIKGTAGFQHISVHPPAKNQESIKHEAIIDEWQGAFLVSKDIRSLAPYVGARYGVLDFIKWEDEKDRKRIHSERHYGIVIGMDYHLNERINVNLEGIFHDGEEFALGLSYDF